MARHFTAALSQYLSLGKAILVAEPLTIVYWFQVTDPLVSQGVVHIVNTASSTQGWGLRHHGQDPNGAVRAQTFDGVTWGSAVSNPRTTEANKWHHACGVFASDVSRTAYCDGANAISGTGDSAPSGMNETWIGQWANQYHDGLVAEVGIWDIELLPFEILLLNSGYSPKRIRPEHLQGYYPLRWNDLDYSDNFRHMTPVNAPAFTDNHPIILEAPKIYQIPFAEDAEADEGFGVSVPIIKRQTIAPPPDGLLQVNWSHPLASKLFFLCVGYGDMALTPINLITGEQGVPQSTEKIELVNTAWGPAMGGNDGLAGRVRFDGVPVLDNDVSGGMVSVRVRVLVSDIDSAVQYLLASGSGEERINMRPCTSYQGQKEQIEFYHDWSNAGTIIQEDPAAELGEMISWAWSYHHDEVSDCDNDIYANSILRGYKTNNVSAAYGQMDPLDVIEYNFDPSGGYAGVFLSYFINGRISEEEAQILIDPRNTWDLVKPLPKHFYFPEAEISGIVSRRAIARGTMRGVGRGVG